MTNVIPMTSAIPMTVQSRRSFFSSLTLAPSLALPPTQAFVEAWEDMDVKGTGLIEATGLMTILLAVRPPMGVKGLDHVTKRVQEIVQEAEIPLR